MADSAIERAARKRRLQFQEAEHVRAMYRWNHPQNIAWAADRHRCDEAADLLRRIADLEAALNRRSAADGPEQTEGEPNESERPVEKRSVPISITWRKSRHG
jgi:hypothetical protein